MNTEQAILLTPTYLRQSRDHRLLVSGRHLPDVGGQHGVVEGVTGGPVGTPRLHQVHRCPHVERQDPIVGKILENEICFNARSFWAIATSFFDVTRATKKPLNLKV